MEKSYGLTFPQKNIWLVDMANSNTPINVIVGIINIKNKFSVEACDIAINKFIEENEGVRLRLKLHNNEPIQYVSEYKYTKIVDVDLSKESEGKIDEFLSVNALCPFSLINSNLYDFKIVRTGDDSGFIFIKLHHMVCDAWSYSNLGKQIMENYEKIVNGAQIVDSDIPSYIDFIEAELDYTKSEKYTRDKEFFEGYLKDLKSPISLKEKVSNTTSALRRSFILSDEQNNKINSFCKENRVSPYALFLAALSTYIYRIKEVDDFVIGTPVLNRSGFKEKQMLGMFVSTLPLRVKIEEGEKFLDVIKSVSKDTMSLFRHQRYPYSKTLEYVHKNTDIKTNLFNVSLSYQNARIDLPNEERFSTDWIFNENISDQLQIHIMDMDSTGKLHIHYDYLKELFSSREIEYIHDRLMAIISNAIHDINVDVENIRIMSKDEENKILNDFNNTKVDYPKDKTVIELFEEQVRKNPNKTAIVFKNNSITYNELDDKSSKFACYLKDNYSIVQGDFIGIMLEKSIDMIVSIIAILKLGACYVPLESTYSFERKCYIIDDSNCKCIITDSYDKKLGNICKIFNISSGDNYISSKYDIVLKDYNYDSNMHVMYTSGTTGQPKGVIITNNNVISLVKNNTYIDFNENDVVLQTGSIVFDASTFEIWYALLNGLTLCLANKKDIMDPIEFENILIENKISFLFLTTALLNQIVDFNPSIFGNLRCLLSGGEIMSYSHVSKIRKINPDIEIVNLYGPTENTVVSTSFLLGNKKYVSVPIGKPIANSSCYICDKKMRLLPMAVEGELVVGGDGVSKGYLNKSDLSKEKFVKDIFSNNGKLYKTGDIASWMLDGNIEFLGRRDNQVKVRGVRIELDEIKSYILKFGQIKSCEVIIDSSDSNTSDKKIIAYYTSDNKENELELIGYLKEKLLNYMIPNKFIQVDKIPLNSNGKVDQKALKEFYNKSILRKIRQEKIEYNGIYLKLYNIFSNVLERKDILDTDSFFELGGDSLLAVKLVTSALSENISITYSDLYKYPSIKELGDMLLYRNVKASISDNISGYNYDKINESLKNNIYNKAESHKSNGKIKGILLTGATGFLGAHILSEYLRNYSGNIYCIIRKKGLELPEERLRQKIEYYFGDKYNNEFGNRIKVVEGDITNNNIFSNKEDMEDIIKDIDTIINAAACVRHFGEIDYFMNVNEIGVKNLVNFATEYDKKLIHISTLSVSGNIIEAGQIYQNTIPSGTIYNETNFYIGQNLDNVYAYTKYMGEKIVYDAIINKGLKAKIMRMGNLMGRYTDGVFQPNVEENAFIGRLKNIIRLNVLPKNILDFYLEFTPIDYAAKAVMILAGVDDKFSTFHLFNHKHVEMVEMDKIFRKLGINLKHITKDDMTQLITNLLSKKSGYKKLQGIILDLNKDKELEYSVNTKVKSDFTIEVLKENGFTWPDIDYDYIRKFFIKVNIIEDIKEGNKNV